MAGVIRLGLLPLAKKLTSAPDSRPRKRGAIFIGDNPAHFESSVQNNFVSAREQLFFERSAAANCEVRAQVIAMLDIESNIRQQVAGEVFHLPGALGIAGCSARVEFWLFTLPV